MEDTTFTLINVKDDVVFNLDRTTSPVKVISFMLGKTGPYTERMTPDEYMAGELNTRVAKLAAVLQSLPR